jgi:uncharacterized protein
MSLKIDADLNRFKDIIKNKVKHNLGKFISSENLIGQQGNKKVKIPLTNIDIPHFVYGGRNGGTGMGPGDVGDPFGPGQNKPGEGDAGDGEGDHDFSAEFTPDELAQIIIEHLSLPNLEPKSKGSVNSEKNKYNRVSNVGNDGLRHFKRTYKEALKRQISTGTYDPENPIVVPIKSDFRYKTYSTKETPEINAVIMYMMDVSGSMGEEQKFIVESEVFWIDLILKHIYKDIESVFIIHDSGAREVTREDFFKVSTAGGTHISSAYELCANIMAERYPFSEYNVYPFHFSDGDNYSQSDNASAGQILTERIFPNCNVFSYGQVKSVGGSGEFINFLKANFKNNDKLTLSEIDSRTDILDSIKTFFEKGK